MSQTPHCSWKTFWAWSRDVAIISIQGELDFGIADHLRQHLDEVAVRAPRLLVLDLSELFFMDVSGLRVLLELRERLSNGGTRLVVVPGRPNVQRLFSLAEVERRFEFLAEASSEAV